MNAQIKYRHIERVSQADEDSNNSYNYHHIEVTSSITADYYTEWTIGNNLNEKLNSERIDGLAEVPSGIDFQNRYLKNKSRSIKRRAEPNASTLNNEIYNRAELTSYT